VLKATLEYEFDKRKPWITKFVIDGNPYGGDYEAFSDKRIDQFCDHFRNTPTILELGSLEGGHTFRLAKRSGVRRVLGLDGRRENVDKARFVQKLLGIGNVEFREANLENCDLSAFGQFDAVLCIGLLYHLPEPWKLVEQVSKIASNLFIWTHYVEEERADIVINGFKGVNYQEAGLTDPLSGLSPNSFWPTLSSLILMLKLQGFETVQLIEDDPKHCHGPCVSLAASA